MRRTTPPVSPSSEKMRGQIGGLAQAQRNAQDGISLVQTAEGALTEVHSMLQRVRDLKVQFGNGTLSTDDQDAIAAEVYQIAQEVGDIVADTKFNGTAVFGAATFAFQVGANDGETITTTAANFGGSISSSATAGLSELTVARERAATKTALDANGGLSSLTIDRQRDQDRVEASRQLRCGAEPSGASPEQPGDLPGEPDVV